MDSIVFAFEGLFFLILNYFVSSLQRLYKININYSPYF